MNTTYMQLKEFLTGLGPDVEERVKNSYFGFWRAGEVFAYVHVGPQFIRVHVKAELPVRPGLVSRIGPPRHRVSRSEIILRNAGDLTKVMDLLRTCYEHRPHFGGLRRPASESARAEQEVHPLPTAQVTWRLVNSLRLDNGKWQMEERHPHVKTTSALANIRMTDTGKFRYAKGIELGGTSDVCRIRISSPSDDGVGCRVLAEALHRLACHYGDVDQIPSEVYLQASGGSFLPRGLLMLKALSAPKTRQVMGKQYSWSRVPAQSHEKAEDYEVRAVAEVLDRWKGYEMVDARRLYLKGVKSKPDGLFIGPCNTAVIVEAKMNRPDFSDGIAQVMQYYSQAKHCPEFQDWTLHLCLVTSEEEPTSGYELWQRWMKSRKELEAFVAE